MFIVITGVTLTSFTVNVVATEVHCEFVLVAMTLWLPAARATATTLLAPGPSIDVPLPSNHSKVKPVVPAFDTPSIKRSVI